MEFNVKKLALTGYERQVLTTARIKTFEDLLRVAFEPPQELDTRYGPDTWSIVQALVTRAELMRIKGIGPLYADLLHMSGIRSVRDLSFQNPQSLTIRLAQNVHKSEAKRAPTLAQVRAWIEQARTLPRVAPPRVVRGEPRAPEAPPPRVVRGIPGAVEPSPPPRVVRGVPRMKAEEEAERPAERYVNLCFTTDAEGKKELDSCQTLKAGQTYYFRLDIGPWSDKTIVKRPRSIEKAVEQFFEKEEELPLEVVLFSADFQLDERTADGLWTSHGRLILPRLGSARTPDEQPYLLFEVGTPPEPGQAQLRVCIYYLNNLLQSLAVQAHITSEEQEVKEGHWADVEYTLTANFAQVERLPARALNIFVNRNPDGTHTIGLKGEEPEPILLNEAEMKNAVGRFRHVMDQIAFDERGYRFDPQSNRAKKDDQIHQDLKDMARVGKLVWNALIMGRQALSEQLQRVLQEPAVIQISPIDLNAVFPWALVYDKPVDARAEGTKACLLWQERRDRHGNLDVAACEKECPHKDRSVDPPIHARRDLVCPYGFWGFRHILEQPLSTQEESDLALEVELAEEGEPLLLIGYREERLNAEREQLRQRQAHQQQLDQILQLVPRASKKAIEEGMKDSSLHLVYFYTHCRHEEQTEAGWEPYLELGQQRAERLVPTDLPDWRQVREIWRKTRPLVFINACHSLDFTPGTLADFLRNFAYLQASGIIGTEISTVEPLACEFAESFFRWLIEGQQQDGKVHILPVGEIFRQVRGQLLGKYNPLGLIYTLYCSAHLKVTKRAATDS